MSAIFNPEDYFRRYTVEEIFGAGAECEVDLGCGDGGFLLQMARHYPERRFLGVERLLGRIRKVCRDSEKQGLTNVKGLRAESRYFLEWMIAPGSIRRLHYLFPDPWPKARHHKRRILQSGTLRLIASRLKPGGIFHAATDHAGYAEWIEELRDVEPALEPIAWPWPESPMLLDRPTTKFENRGLNLDHDIHEFVWRKRADAADAADSADAADPADATREDAR